MSPKLVLVCKSSIFLNAKWILDSGPSVIGRSNDCDIRIPEQSISRRHAIISVADSVTLTDLGSRNGTFVDEMPLGEMSIQLHQSLRFGAVEFRLMDYNSGQAEAIIEDSTRESPRAMELNSTDLTINALSAAQRRVLNLLIKGLKEEDVASHLHLSKHTVHTHAREIYRIVGVHSRAELLARLILQR